MNVMIVDDEKLALDKIKEQLATLEFVTNIYAYDSPYAALDEIKNLPVDAASLDIEMYDLDGIKLASLFKYIRPKLKIIFLTAHSEYAVKAFKIRANGYLLKPVSTEELQEELLQLTKEMKPVESAKIEVQTFGSFEVFVYGHPLTFTRNKAKELLAYLVSRKRAFVSLEELHGILFEDKPITTSSKSQLRNLIASLTKSLRDSGIEDMLLKKRNHLAVNPSAFHCDYYEFLNGNLHYINSFMGEFMSNYDWAEFITGYLEGIHRK